MFGILYRVARPPYLASVSDSVKISIIWADVRNFWVFKFIDIILISTAPTFTCVFTLHDVFIYFLFCHDLLIVPGSSHFSFFATFKASAVFRWSLVAHKNLEQRANFLYVYRRLAVHAVRLTSYWHPTPARCRGLLTSIVMQESAAGGHQSSAVIHDAFRNHIPRAEVV